MAIKKINQIMLDDIKILTFADIKTIYSITEKDIKKFLLNINNAENYWYPFNTFNNVITENIIAIFRKKFADVTINEKHGVEYTEIFLNSIDKHIFMYSLLNHFTT